MLRLDEINSEPLIYGDHYILYGISLTDGSHQKRTWLDMAIGACGALLGIYLARSGLFKSALQSLKLLIGTEKANAAEADEARSDEQAGDEASQHGLPQAQPLRVQAPFTPTAAEGARSR